MRFHDEEYVKWYKARADKRYALDDPIRVNGTKLNKWALKVKQSGICAVCKNPSEDAHHIIDKILYPELMLNLNNGVPLCARCHSQAHGKKMKSRIV